MKKIAFTYNSCICMIQFLPDFECIDRLLVYCTCMVGRGVCWAFSSVQKEVGKRPNFFEMYLATAVAKLSKRGVPKYS